MPSLRVGSSPHDRDDPFHAAAWAAFVEQAALTGGSPDSEATRRRAFELYEQLLAEKHGVTRS